ncbi:hypothetical protein [Streptomyces sp. SA15]|uniref:hypothetical protein n=1 Tax=Streptomyces sp. SA15 TaxID=934019 RepID=UPI0011806E3B|nr:hypothetical protein [Streptomyces sp. SA15]
MPSRNEDRWRGPGLLCADTLAGAVTAVASEVGCEPVPRAAVVVPPWSAAACWPASGFGVLAGVRLGIRAFG